MCVPWELNPQPYVLLTQCSTTEPQEQGNTKDYLSYIFRQKKHKPVPMLIHFKGEVWFLWHKTYKKKL